MNATDDAGPSLRSIGSDVPDVTKPEEPVEEELDEEESEVAEETSEEAESKEELVHETQVETAEESAPEKKGGLSASLRKLKYGYMSMLMSVSKKPRRIAVTEGRKLLEEQSRGSSVTYIPPITDPEIEEVQFYEIDPPFTYSRVLFDNEKNEYVYEGIEPQISQREKDLLEYLKESLNKTLSYDWEEMGEKDKEQYIKESVESLIRSRSIKLDESSEQKMLYYIVRDFIGYGQVNLLMADPLVEDVSCDGTGVPIFIYHRDFESIKTSVVFDTDESLDSFVILLGQRCGKQVSVSNPILDGTTSEGHRVQAAYAHEVTTRGSAFTIRRFKEKPFTPVDIVVYNSASPEMIAYLWIAVEHGESAIIAGGTASGKTATLNAMMLFISPTAKVVSIEDTREINLPLENWIPGVTRSGVGEKGVDGKAAGEIDMYELVRAALRQRPNYIMVGEVRGKETYTMFQAMATGHTTYSTMHADSVKSMVHRLENPPINCPRILLTALNNVIIQKHARVGKQVVRRIFEIIEIVGFEPETNELITNTVYEWEQATDTFLWKGHSFLFDKIQEMKGMTSEEMRKEHLKRIHMIKYMFHMKMNDYKAVGDIVASYYKEPEETYEDIKNHLIELSDEELLQLNIGREELAEDEILEAEDSDQYLLGGDF